MAMYFGKHIAKSVNMILFSQRISTTFLLITRDDPEKGLQYKKHKKDKDYPSDIYSN
jgi:hypothetical protein